MPRIVTRLVTQSRNKRRVNVHLDDAYAFSLADTLAATLFVGQALDEATIAQLIAQDTYQRGMDKALRLIARRPRSQHEIDEALRRADFPPPVRERILARLHEMDYLDDKHFARWWVENRTTFNPRSLGALRQDLRQKGVAGPIIDEVLADLDDAELALAAGRKRAYRWQHLAQDAFEKKMVGYLQRRGFSFPLARQVAQTLWEGWKAED